MFRVYNYTLKVDTRATNHQYVICYLHSVTWDTTGKVLQYTFTLPVIKTMCKTHVVTYMYIIFIHRFILN